MTHKQFYEWCKARCACPAGLRYLRLNQFSLARFWDKCAVPEYRVWVLYWQGSTRSTWKILAKCGLRSLHQRNNVALRLDRKAANAYLKKHYKCPKLTPVKSRKAA